MDIHWRADFTLKLLGKLSKELAEQNKVNADIVDEAITAIIILDGKLKEVEQELANIGGPLDD